MRKRRRRRRLRTTANTGKAGPPKDGFDEAMQLGAVPPTEISSQRV